MRSLPVVVLCLAGIVGLATACSSGSGEGGPQPAGSTASTSAAPVSGVPKVAHPLDASKFEAAPCSSVTASQLDALAVPSASRDAQQDVTGTGCVWSAGTGTAANGMYLTWDTSHTNGLGWVYQAGSTWTYWVPLTVNGYPAVQGGTVDNRQTGSCTIYVGVSDQLVFILTYKGSLLPQESKPCQLATQAATDVVQNLGG
ncbi:MAG TPA: DUF3558 domain-containing protein [Pseudonocardiaceae bacterium]|nr:DUF3558 domain-containing protein [Pseudonocardiaceae bacterium]